MAMASIAIDLESLKADVVRQLDEQERKPLELLKLMENTYPDSDIKEAVLRLLQEGSIEFTPNRLLKVHSEAL
jgi:hypothetical protein